MDKFIVENWGVVDYQSAYERQRALVEEVITGGPQRLVFCEHPPVLTLGRMFDPESLIYTRDDILSQGVSIVPVDRGGDVTLHAPGQLVVYIIADLNRHGRDLRRYLEHLEQVAVDLLKDFDILAMGIAGKRGVFVPTFRQKSLESGSRQSETIVGISSQKIVSIGVGVRKWVTYHGLGINVNTDLSLFNLIKPCGLSVQMTSMQKLLGRPGNMEDVQAAFVNHFKI